MYNWVFLVSYSKLDGYLLCFRDPRGFAVKFYAEDGNWDVVGNNTPVFFIRDPILFPSFIHTQKRNPVTHLKVISCTLKEEFIGYLMWEHCF